MPRHPKTHHERKSRKLIVFQELKYFLTYIGINEPQIIANIP